MRRPADPSGRLHTWRSTAAFALLVCPSLLGAAEIDPLAPAGVSLGTKLSAVDAALIGAGYERIQPCVYMKQTRVNESISVWLHAGKGCAAEASIVGIIYEQRGIPVDGSPAEVAGRISRRIGAEPICPQMDEESVDCRWASPPNAPAVKVLSLRYQAGADRLILSLDAKDQETAASPAPKSDTPAIEANNDVLTPGGLAIGMAAAEAKRMLGLEGFSSTQPAYLSHGKGTRCEYRKDEAFISAATGSQLGDCLDSDPLSYIRYAGLHIAGSLQDFVKQTEGRLGAAGSCSGLSDNNLSLCEWFSPPSAPLVKRMTLHGPKSGLIVTLTAVDDLEARVTLPKATAPPPEEQAWWTEELAQAEAGGAKFSGSGKYDLLSASEQERLGGEAEYVYDYCKSQDLFAAFHDCRCVAGKFIDERLAREEQQRTAASADPDPEEAKDPLERWRSMQEQRNKDQGLTRGASSQASQKELIGIADAVAAECPSKAGAANYAHSNCKSVYASRMPEGLETFCDCYAETYSNLYMKDPRAQMPNIVGVGSAALLECHNRGIPSPLHR